MHPQLDPTLLAQHSLVTRHQAWTLGFTARQVDHLIARSMLIPVHRGVLRDPAGPVTLEQRALGAVLASGADAMASHRLAIALWGMRNYQCNMLEIAARGQRRNPGIVAHRCARAPEPTMLRNVPVTTAARTMLDAATVVSKGVLTMWLETWLSSKVLTLEGLEAEMGLDKHHRGVALLSAALTDRTLVHAEADSPPEAVLGLLIAAHGLPPVALHHLVTLRSGVEFELDWSYPLWEIAFEMDGYGIHMRSLAAFEHDRYRRNELEIEGWQIMNFTKRMVERKPKVVIDQIRRMVETREQFATPHGAQ